MRNAIDFSFARPSSAEVAAAGVDVIVYTGPARPDKAYIDAMRAAGVAVTLVQESDPNRSQQGFAAGVTDAQYADGRADEIGYPLSCSIAYVVSDGSAGDPSSGAASITAYAKGVASVSRRPRFYYGNQYATNAALSGDPGALGSWIPSTWGTATLLRQEANIASPIADTDLNTVHLPYGAWGQEVPVPPAPLPATNGARGMLVGLRKKVGTPNHDAYIVDGGRIVHQFLGDIVPWGFVNTQKDAKDFAASAGVPPFVFNDAEWAKIDKWSA